MSRGQMPCNKLSHYLSAGANFSLNFSYLTSTTFKAASSNFYSEKQHAKLVTPLNFFKKRLC